jgi:hypothetical protein
MADHPDIYADGFNITMSTFGVTITLIRSEPGGEAGPHEQPTVIVGRIRLSPQLAMALSEQLTQAMAGSAPVVVPGAQKRH